MVNTTNFFKHDRLKQFTCERIPIKNVPSCCGKGCLFGRLASLIVVAFALILVVGTILELSYRIYQLIKSCIKGIAHDKDQAMANVADSCWALLISPAATIIGVIKGIAAALLHLGILFKHKP